MDPAQVSTTSEALESSVPVPCLLVAWRSVRESLKSKSRKSVSLEMARPAFGGRKPRGEGLATKRKEKI